METWELAEFLKDVSDNATEISVCKEECKNCTYTDDWYISQIGEWLLSEEMG